MVADIAPRDLSADIAPLRYKKAAPRYFCFQISLNLPISFTFQINNSREMFLENSVPGKYLFTFPYAFFSRKVFEKYL